MMISFETMKRYIPTIIGDHSARYDAAIISAEEWLVTEILSRPLLEAIQTDPYRDVEKIVERVLCYKAYGIAIPTLDLIETARGFGVVQDDNLVPASPARVQALRASMETNVSSILDMLLERLEQIPALREEWKKTPSYSMAPGFYIDSLRTFRAYGSFDGTRLDFIKALPTLLGIMLRVIEPWISPEYSRELLAGSPLSDKDKAILENMRFALVAHYKEDLATAGAYLTHARQMMMAAPNDYPTFKGSAVYKRLTQTAEQNTSIGVFV